MSASVTHADRLRLAAISETAPRARVFVRNALRERGLTGFVDDALVIINELTTNAVHAVPGRMIEFGIRSTTKGILLYVEDPSPVLPVFREPDYLAETGRGLHLIQALASRGPHWEPVDGGKVVWAELWNQ